MPTVVSPHSSDPPNPWEGYKLTLRTLLDDPSEPTHAIVIQDDVELCRNLPLAGLRIAASKPNDPVLLFHARLPAGSVKGINEAGKRRECYVPFRPSAFCPVVAVLWPVRRAREFLEWAETARLPGYPNLVASDDACFGTWQKRKQIPIWITVPSLVEHPDRADSLIGRRALWGRDKTRVAHRYIGDGDPLDIDW